MSDELYYLQDSRNYCGNDVMWWKIGGSSYTTNLKQAGVYSRESALERHNNRKSDIPWHKDYIDNKSRPTVDVQYIDRKDGAVIK